MDGKKSALASRGVWGGIIAGAGGAVAIGAMVLDGLAGVQVTAGEQAEIAGHVTDAAEGFAAGDYGKAALAVASLIGGALAVYGRIKAKTEIGR